MWLALLLWIQGDRPGHGRLIQSGALSYQETIVSRHPTQLWTWDYGVLNLQPDCNAKQTEPLVWQSDCILGILRDIFTKVHFIEAALKGSPLLCKIFLLFLSAETINGVVRAFLVVSAICKFAEVFETLAIGYYKGEFPRGKHGLGQLMASWAVWDLCSSQTLSFWEKKWKNTVCQQNGLS